MILGWIYDMQFTNCNIENIQTNMELYFESEYGEVLPPVMCDSYKEHWDTYDTINNLLFFLEMLADTIILICLYNRSKKLSITNNADGR